MSELKAFTFGLGQYTEDGSPCVVAFDGEKNPRLASDEKFYLKSEADKAIARNKYKRCLAMAEWCSYKSEVFDQYSRHNDYLPNIEKYRRKRNHYADRCNKLLLFAEKFKPNNSTAQ